MNNTHEFAFRDYFLLYHPILVPKFQEDHFALDSAHIELVDRQNLAATRQGPRWVQGVIPREGRVRPK